AESFSEMCVMVAVDAPAATVAMPPELVPIVARCLAKNPAERYASVADLARDLACLARDPDKAQELVDRMYRMLRRGVRRRTPPAGVALVASPSGSYPQLPSATPTGFPAVVPTGSPSEVLRASEPPPEIAGGRGHGRAPSDGGSLATATVAVPAFAHHPRAMSPGYASYAGYAYPVSQPRQDGAALARPEQVRGARLLTATHVVARPHRGWLVTLITAVVALAAATAVMVATRGGAPTLREPSGPTRLRVIPGGRPAAVGAEPAPVEQDGPAPRGSGGER
ncbi:MAG TPA: hypothetical protein VFT22_38935, partial [Kofleriaceae bacterium]|nr:hypothetical protein [Kofleriaceae bacterium]